MGVGWNPLFVCVVCGYMCEISEKQEDDPEKGRALSEFSGFLLLIAVLCSGSAFGRRD